MACFGEKTFWNYIEVLTLIMVSVTPWIPQSVKCGLLGCLIAINMYYAIKKKGQISISLSAIIVTSLFLFPSLIDVLHTSSTNPYSAVNLLYPVNFLCGYIIAKNYGKQKFYTIMESIVFVLAILSLVGMSIYYINPSLIRAFPTYNYYDTINHTIFFFNYQFVGNWMPMRNAGIAWEPGVFQIVLNLGLVIAISRYSGKQRLIRVCVYTLAIILTKSTMGFIILFINIILLLKEEKKYWFLLVMAISIFSAFISKEFEYQVSNKLYGSTSFSARYTPLLNAIRYTWYKPLGIGSTGYNAIYQQMNLGSFDSYTQVLMRYGYPLLIYIVLKLTELIKKDFFMGTTMILSLFSSPAWGLAFFVVFYYVSDGEAREYV